MEFEDASGTRYQLSEETEALTSTKKPIWPWVVGGLAVAGGLVWMASQTSRSPNPVDPQIEALIVEARDPNTSRARLVDLSNHPKAEVRRALLDNPNLCPTDDHGLPKIGLLFELSKEFPEDVANHPFFVLHAMIEHGEYMERVVAQIAEQILNQDTIEHLLSTWGSFSWSVRWALGANPSSPVGVLRALGTLTTEENEDVRCAVAANPSTPEDLLRLLGNQKTEPDSDVRDVVARNPNTPVDVLRRLANKKNERHQFVRLSAKKALVDRGLA